MKWAPSDAYYAMALIIYFNYIRRWLGIDDFALSLYAALIYTLVAVLMGALGVFSDCNRRTGTSENTLGLVGFGAGDISEDSYWG